MEVSSLDVVRTESERKLFFLQRAVEAEKHALGARDDGIAKTWRMIAATWRTLASQIES